LIIYRDINILFGAPEEIQTPDPQIRGLVLEQRSSLVRLAAQGSHGTAPGPG
jgi:hypothetical protein